MKLEDMTYELVDRAARTPYIYFSAQRSGLRKLPLCELGDRYLNIAASAVAFSCANTSSLGASASGLERAAQPRCAAPGWHFCY